MFLIYKLDYLIKEKLLMPYIYEVEKLKGEIFDNRQTKNLTLKSQSTSQTITVMYNFYMHLEKGDIVSSEHKLADAEILKTYFILLQPDKEGFLKRRLMCIINFNNTPAKLIYGAIKEFNRDFESFSNLCLSGNINDIKAKFRDVKIELTSEHVAIIAKKWKYWYVDRKIKMYGLSDDLIENSGYTFSAIIDVLEKNPFKIFGLSINKCIELAKIFGIEVQTYHKIGHAVCNILSKYLDDNSVMCMEEKILHKIIRKEIGIAEKLIERLEDFLSKTFEIGYLAIGGKKYVFTPASFCEYSMVVNRIINYAKENKTIKSDIPKPPSFLSEEQSEAFKSAMTENIVIISGCAGSGKSTTTVEIMRGLAQMNVPMCVTSFTGKAVSRIKEIWYNVIKGKDLSEREPIIGTLNMLIKNPIKEEFRVLLIDEASMVSTSLIGRFFIKYRHNYRLILIGDNNQLRPISKGAFFYDLYESCAAKTHLLTINHRVSSEYQEGMMLKSNIASLISSRPELLPGKDFNIINKDTEEGALRIFTDLVKKLHEFGVSHDQIRIISFFTDQLLKLNKIVIKEYLNKEVGENTFVEGQRIVVTKNDYNLGVINGDNGEITDISEGKASFLREGPNDIAIVPLNILAHGYATTVHKAQGSEYKTVILFISKREKDPGNFLNINLLYTALSRAKKSVYVIGHRQYLDDCLSKLSIYKKEVLYTDLRERLQISDKAPSYIIDDEDDYDEEPDIDFD